jgi:hypothetical protein
VRKPRSFTSSAKREKRFQGGEEVNRSTHPSTLAFHFLPSPPNPSPSSEWTQECPYAERCRGRRWKVFLCEDEVSKAGNVLGDLYGLVVLNTVVLSPASFECSELEG